jgi:hypothetical protein
LIKCATLAWTRAGLELLAADIHFHLQTKIKGFTFTHNFRKHLSEIHIKEPNVGQVFDFVNDLGFQFFKTSWNQRTSGSRVSKPSK